MEALTLYELNGLVRGTLERTLQAEYWLQAELSEVREAYNGHCYLEFVQKSVNGRDLVAKARGVILGWDVPSAETHVRTGDGADFIAGTEGFGQGRGHLS